VRNRGITIEVLAPEVGEAVTVPVLEAVVEEQVEIGVHQSQLPLVGEVVRPSLSFDNSR
jgi:hypothetical protein